MVDAHFFSRRVVILSGPEALFGLRLLKVEVVGTFIGIYRLESDVTWVSCS